MRFNIRLAGLSPWLIHTSTTTAGVVLATSLMMALFISQGAKGIPVPARLEQATFTVAMMVGAREEAKVASENVETVVAEAIVVPAETATDVVTVATASSLPKAVAATAEATAVADPVVKPDKDEVIPPARVSMPGGRLMAEDSTVGGTQPDILGLSKDEVLLRYLINEQGIVVRGGIFRSGSDPLRDTFIHKAMKSQIYNPKDWLQVSATEKIWMVELTIPYNKRPSDVIP